MEFNLNTNDQQKLDTYLGKVEDRAKHFIGYPIATDFDYSEVLGLLKHPLNNVGDPLVESTYDLNSRSLELEVVQFFAKQFRANPMDNWGYVTNGGSEGNLYALYIARELYPKGMVYYSESTHYSVQKNIHLLNMPSIVIKSQANGEMDYEDLAETIQMNRQCPAIILANIGTTMTEAKDDLNRIKDILKKLAIKNSYIHCDAALAGGYAAFLEPKPAYDFADGADSIAISGHKFIGSPIPCGVVLVKKSYRDRIGRTIAYVGTVDSTITGSRNGHSAVFLWYSIKKLGAEGLKYRIDKSLELAAFAEEKLKSIGIEAWRNTNAITVVFPTPVFSICQKWQLASENGYSHIICMPGVTQARIEELINDILESKEILQEVA